MTGTEDEIKTVGKEKNITEEHADVRTMFREKIFVERTDEIQKKRAKLPIFEEEQAIVEAVNENTVVVFIIYCMQIL